MPDRVLLAVDGNSLVHRAFHAQNGAGARSASGHSIWAVRGLLTQLVQAVERVNADAVLVGFDDPRRSVRRETWPQYKAHRVDKPDSLISQLLLAATVLRELGVAVVVPDGLEADDVLCSAAAQAPTAGLRTVIMTSDRDSFALIDDDTRVLRIINGGVEASPLITADRLVTLLGIRPEQYRDFAALRGDPSDNLPGVTGIGAKTAARLLAALGSARAAFEDVAANTGRVAAELGAGVAAKLKHPDAQANWELNCQIMGMRHDLDLALDGSGSLPLPATTVRSVYAEQQLLGTLPAALRVLAHAEGEPAPVAIASEPVRRWFGSSPGPRRPPPLPDKREDDQLALF